MSIVDTETGEVIAPTLESCERVIESGLQTFVEVGNALLAIRDERLYKESGFKTFEAYCQERWKFERAHASRLMDGAQVAAILSPIGGHLANERQARALAPLKDNPAALAAAWNEAEQEAREEGKKVTHARIEKVVAKRHGRGQGTGRSWTRDNKGNAVAKVLRNLNAIAESITAMSADGYAATQEEAEGLDRTIRALRALRKSLIVQNQE